MLRRLDRPTTRPFYRGRSDGSTEPKATRLVAKTARLAAQVYTETIWKSSIQTKGVVNEKGAHQTSGVPFLSTQFRKRKRLLGYSLTLVRPPRPDITQLYFRQTTNVSV